jgi:hypothetical protein
VTGAVVQAAQDPEYATALVRTDCLLAGWLAGCHTPRAGRQAGRQANASPPPFPSPSCHSSLPEPLYVEARKLQLNVHQPRSWVRRDGGPLLLWVEAGHSWLILSQGGNSCYCLFAIHCLSQLSELIEHLVPSFNPTAALGETLEDDDDTEEDMEAGEAGQGVQAALERRAAGGEGLQGAQARAESGTGEPATVASAPGTGTATAPRPTAGEGRPVTVSVTPPPPLCIKPTHGAAGVGVARLDTPLDLQLYAHALGLGVACLPANTLTTPHP